MAVSKLNPSAGGIPYGNTAGRPASPTTGKLYSNGETARLELYTSSGAWENIVQEVPGVSSISGNYSQSANSGTITIYGTNFVSGAIASATGTNSVSIQASSTTYNSLVELTAVFTGLSNANEPYDITVTNPSNLFGILPDALYVNASPIWVTSSGSLGTFTEQVAISVSATATDSDSTISYALASGSTLPSGISLNSSTGAITGTLPDIASNTTYSFTINASDGVNAVVPRTFSITSTNTVIEALVVAGGGGGGYDRGSGGGAGGMIDITQFIVSKGTPYTVTVGNGGAAGYSGNNTGGNGQNSIFATLTALGGGGGNMTGSGQNGGSGGGGGWSGGSSGSSLQSAQSGDSGTYGYGNAGGAGGNGIIGGGGGAGAAGSTSSPTTSSNRPNGGIGRQSSITGTATYYAGGGGGGQAFDGPNGQTTPYFYIQGFGGTGGGGNGGSTNGGAGTAGTANTGGGGGGGANIPQGLGAAGGSGVVVIAYPNTSPALTISGGLTYDQPTRSGYRVYRFTAGSGTVTF